MAMLKKTAASTWVSLHKAFEHVLRAERSRELTEHRLRYVLGERTSGPQVRCRAGFAIAPMQRQRERSDVMLPADFWVLEFRDDNFSDRWCAIVNWAEDSGRLPLGHPFAPWTAYRIEVCWQDLVAIWPEAKKRSRPGRKQIYDRAKIEAEGRSYLRTHDRPASLN